jgi:hypothetical protein
LLKGNSNGVVLLARCALPTTGVIVGDDFFHVANTQIDSMGAGGQNPPTAKRRDLILLKVSLN